MKYTDENLIFIGNDKSRSNEQSQYKSTKSVAAGGWVTGEWIRR